MKNCRYKVSKVSKVSFNKIIYNKETFFNYKIKIEIKTTTTIALKSELKYSPMSEGNTSIAEPNL